MPQQFRLSPPRGGAKKRGVTAGDSNQPQMSIRAGAPVISGATSKRMTGRKTKDSSPPRDGSRAGQDGFISDDDVPHDSMRDTDPMRAPFSFSNTNNRFRRKGDDSQGAPFPGPAKRIVRKKKLSPIKHDGAVKARTIDRAHPIETPTNELRVSLPSLTSNSL